MTGGQKGIPRMKKEKKTYLLTAVLLISALLAGCGKNAELDKFYSEMDDFTAQVNISFGNRR